MASRRTAKYELTIEDLDRELIARGAQIPREQLFKFKDIEGTPARDDVMARIKGLYDTAFSSSPNPALASIDTWELVKLLFHKTRQLEENRKRGIWYEDHRMDFNGITDERVKKNLKCVAAIMLKDNLIDEKNGFSTIKVKNYGDVFNLSEIESFRDQPISSGRLWSGFLVKKDIIATAGHCVRESTLKDLRIVFGYKMLDPYTPVTRVSNENVYNCVKIISLVYNPKKSGVDWALLQLDREVQGQEVAELSKDDVAPLQSIYVIGHPVGLPLKYAAGARVRSVEDSFFLADQDLYMGNSGSPVFNSDTHEVIGIVVRDDTIDFRWTDKGWVSIIYPNSLSRGTQCTRVSEFIDNVKKGSGKPVIYNITIEPTGKKNHFHITWYNPENNTKNSFDQEAEIKPIEIKKLWYENQYQLPIGEKLFRFLDGEAHYFQRVLNEVNQHGETLQVNLHTCHQTADWPFELLAENNTFLLPHRLHLVRYVSDWNEMKEFKLQDRPLKLLFMACSAVNIQPKLDFEMEEEVIFHITKNLAIDMEVEDSGTLEGLSSQLQQQTYDVVLLSGHAGVDEKRRPFFVMEDENGYERRVFPDELWNEALIENPPQLLFLSGDLTGESPEVPYSIDKASFARQLVEKYGVPVVLGWGGSVADKQAIHAEKEIFYELSRGRSILDAVQRARYELINNFPPGIKPAWPLLQLFSSCMQLNAIVKENQQWRPKLSLIKHVLLKNSQVKILAEGFVGRRQQLQTSLRALKQYYDKLGVVILGTGGLGKSCLAGKICERFTDHNLIIVNGNLNVTTLEAALMEAFIVAQDEKGRHILNTKKSIQERLADLCTTSFKEKNYLFLMDGFDININGADKGQPGSLLPEAADLLKIILHYLLYSSKMTQLIITSRYEFSLTVQNKDVVAERLEKVWLTSFQIVEQHKKIRHLKNILSYEDQSVVTQLLEAGHGNPRLMEWLDVMVGEMKAVKVKQLLEAVKVKQEEFILINLLRELLQWGGNKFLRFLRWLSIYRRPIMVEGVKQIANKAGVGPWKKLLLEGIGLSLIEYEQVRERYQVTPLLREELLENLEERKVCHEIAFNYYKKICESMDSYDPILGEEWIFHALGCDKEAGVPKQIGNADYLEGELRNILAKGLYSEGKKYLKKAIEISFEIKERLKKEFGFIYNFDKLDKGENNWEQNEAQINWRRKVWQILSIRSKTALELIDTQENIKDLEKEKSESIVDGEKIESKVVKEKKTGKITSSEEKGEKLEKAVFILFKQFFERCEQENEKFQIKNARQQDRGRQLGHDLKFVIGITGNRKMRILVECKNVNKPITKDDIGGKLLAAEAYHQNIPIDHWILVSPQADVSNELDELLELWEKIGKYPFKVQAWTPAAGIKEFFGLIPGIYDSFFKPSKGEVHPRDWDRETKQKVQEFWKQKLQPPLRLPAGWEQYLRSPGKFLLHGDPPNLEALYKNHVTMNCKDDKETHIRGKTLEEKVNEWLEKPVKQHPALILLGEFGDGKSVFSYILSRKLGEKFIESPSDGWLPIRFSLKDFSFENINTSRDFVRRRLEEFGADINGWNTLRKSEYKILAILDGFDEISKKLDHKTILKNIKKIIECYQNEFSNMKLLITSRKHFFENQEHKDQLLQRIGNPQLLNIAPIDRKTVGEHLKEYAKEINEEEKFNKLKDFHDPIGLASKPLFMEMVKVSLKELPNKNLDELILYETYTRQSLERKFEYLEDEELETSPINILENMKEILENLAVKLHQADAEFIYLSDVHGSDKYLERLWKMSNPEDCAYDDEVSRIAVRSLLKRVGIESSKEGKKWPVDFCHRSMREYFVARAVCKMVEYNLEQARQFLRNYYLNHEIVFFTSKMMKKSGFDYTENLWQLIRETKGQSKREKFKIGHLGSNAANLLYQYRGILPHNDWSSLVLDGVDFSGADLSGKDFSHTSFHYANLDNVNFTNTDFSNCDLTGVRLEEASPVHAIAVTRDENIYALYDDGIIREWKYKRVRKPYPDNLEEIQKLNYIRLIAQPGNDLTVIDDRQLVFFDKENKRLKERARIDIKPSLIPIKASSDTILLFNEAGNQHMLQLVDLEKQSVINEKAVESFALCDHLGSSAFIICGKDQYLQVVDITSQKRKTIIQPYTENITCLDTCSCKDSSGQYRLACGQADGKIVIFQIFLSQWEVKKIFECHYHEKTVNDIAFIDEENIISGGFDKKIFKINISREENALCKPVEFKLHLQCKGMKIDGIKPDEKRLFLEKLIAKASTGDDVYKEK